MSDKVLLAKKDQTAPQGYKRVTPPKDWKMQSQFDVKLDATCPSCWGSGVANFVKPGARGHNVGEKEAPEGITKKNCGCLLSAILRYLERLNRGPAKAPGSAQEKPVVTPMSVQARAAFDRAQGEMDALDEKRAEAVGRVDAAVVEALAETEQAQDAFDKIDEVRGAALDTAEDLRTQAADHRRRAVVLDENAELFDGLAAQFQTETIALSASLDACKRFQAKRSEDAARLKGRWADRMKGPKNRLERLRRRLELAEKPVVGVDFASGPDKTVGVVMTADGKHVLDVDRWAEGGASGGGATGGPSRIQDGAGVGGRAFFSHDNPPPGFAPCTREMPHDGPRALPLAGGVASGRGSTGGMGGAGCEISISNPDGGHAIGGAGGCISGGFGVGGVGVGGEAGVSGSISIDAAEAVNEESAS